MAAFDDYAEHTATEWREELKSRQESYKEARRRLDVLRPAYDLLKDEQDYWSGEVSSADYELRHAIEREKAAAPTGPADQEVFGIDGAPLPVAQSRNQEVE